ncbi:MAG: hypothetical protein FH761_05890 [Firmicutes bacterium]|nr:hypothetical protein [Bacillota bacterium]
MNYNYNSGQHLIEKGKVDKTVESYTETSRGFIRFLTKGTAKVETASTSLNIILEEALNIHVYNMFGIHAFDRDPIGEGSKYAYKMGWTTPENAIKGGAKWISEKYINNSSHRQNNLYKMRWNPSSPGKHQYATDVRWAINQVRSIKNMYDKFPNANLKFEIPIYKK